MQILCNASSDDHIPMFHNLFSLKFYGCLYFEWHTIRLLLGQAPKLQILAFESCPNQSYDGPAPDGCWEDPRDVPECLSLHLTTCHYKGFLGDEDEMHLVRASVVADVKIMSFYHTKCLLYYFTTSFYNISFIRCFIIQFYTLK